MRLDDLNAVSPDVAVQHFLRCCGSTKWARAMAAARPFATIAAVDAAADQIDKSLEPSDWLEAFHAHPRIGEQAAEERAGKAGKAGRPDASASWSNEEQAGAREASKAVRHRLAVRNRDYEERFGYIFIVCATGVTGGEMLAELERRLGHNPGDELSIAAAEQRKITRLRIAKLLAE